MNKKSLLIMAITLTVSLLNCGSSVQMLPDPIENQSLLIGCLIFDIDGFRDTFATIRQNIEVVILGRIIQDGEVKTISYWATTDENGCFFIANVLDGEYAIKGFRTHLIGLGNLVIENQLIDPQRNYFELKNIEVISTTGELFDVRSDRRIVNFHHNIITLHRNGIVESKRYERLRELKLSTGETLDRPPISSYFLEKFPGSGWEGALNRQIN